MKRHPLLSVAFLALVLACLLLGAAYIKLPFVLTKWVLPQIEKATAARLALSISRCDAKGMEIRDFAMTQDNLQVSIGAISAVWSLGGLSRHEIDRLELRDASARWVMSPQTVKTGKNSLFPCAIRHLLVNNANFLIKMSKNTVKIDDFCLETAFYHKKPLKIEENCKFSVGAVYWDELFCGSAHGLITAGNSSYKFDGQFIASSNLMAGGCLAVNGQIAYESIADPAFNIAFHTPPLAIDSAALPSFMTGLLPLDFRLDLAVEGRLAGSLEHPVMPVCVSITNGVFNSKDGKVAVAGLQTQVRSGDILRGETAPAQELNAASVAMGESQLTQVHLVYQLQPGGILFVEKGEASWCGGLLRLYALRLQSQADMDLTIYCDQLHLDELLRQMGFKEIFANSSVSGRLPVRVKGNQVVISSGELYSHPGISGVLKIGGTEVLAQSIGPDNPAYGNILFTQAALKNFMFDWLRMQVNTSGHQATINTSLYGKPAAPLPFRYDAKLGSFVEVKTTVGGISSPVELTMNINLPLDGFFYNRKGLKQFLDGIQ